MRTWRLGRQRGLLGLALLVAWRIRTGGHPGPYMRYDRHKTFQATTGPHGPAWRFVAHEGQYMVTVGRVFRRHQRCCTLIMFWVPG